MIHINKKLLLMANGNFLHKGYLYTNSYFHLLVNKNTDFDKYKNLVERGIKYLRTDQARLSYQ